MPHKKTQKVFGFVKPSPDAHTLGINYAADLLRRCGYETHIARMDICDALSGIKNKKNTAILKDWLIMNRINILCFSYRLEPSDGVKLFGELFYILKKEALMDYQGGKIKELYFAGLPPACETIRKEYRENIITFFGDETPVETLSKLGVPKERLPLELKEGCAYDEDRLKFGRELIEEGKYLNFNKPPNGDYPEYGTQNDSFALRLDASRKKGTYPLIRAHIGPYLPNRKEAITLFINWIKQLAREGMLDVLSIGTSQLTQSKFGENWDDKSNGGGVPVNSEDEFYEIWKASRPMLVRTYAGTKRIKDLLKIYEKTINNAWNALSFWWFSRIDGRGDNGVYENLLEHTDCLKFIAEINKPFEPNIPHHFAFRGADDITYITSAYLAAKTAKKLGIKYLILQNMLNTPKSTWGINDLAKSRAMLKLVKSLEDQNFKVYLQTRAGLDYFSPDLNKSRAQLAAVTAMMDDIEPQNELSPDIIHVVSFSEAISLATPEILDESIKITLHSLDKYRLLRKEGKIKDMSLNPDIDNKTSELVENVLKRITAIEKSINNPYSAEGLYLAFASGFLPVPYLWEEVEEFRFAVNWKTAILNGGVCLVDNKGMPLTEEQVGTIAGLNIETATKNLNRRILKINPGRTL
jgi:hypothetical protein